MMTEQEKDKTYLSHIKESIDYIEAYLVGFSREMFEKEVGTQDKVIRRFEIIGEAFNQISAKFRKSHPELDWRQAVDFRNMLIHHYFQLDLDVVWDTAKNDLPPLKLQIAKIIKEL